MGSESRDVSYGLRPGLVLEYLGDNVAILDQHGAEADRLTGESARVVRDLVGRRHASASDLNASASAVAELLGKGVLREVRTPSRRSALTAGAVGVTALALPSRLAAESAGAAGGQAPQIPGAPTGLAVTNGDRAVRLSFTAGSTGGGTITNYEYSTDGGTTWVALSPASATSPIVITTRSNTGTLLVNGVTYSIMLRSRNSEGETGNQSMAVSATPTSSGAAVGGISQTYLSEGSLYRMHEFNSNDSFELNRTLNVEYLVVGGGGAGGYEFRVQQPDESFVYYAAGGGGAGGLRAGTFVGLPASSYSVTVGNGGLTNNNGDAGNPGQPSSFHSITSAGGGGGSSYKVSGVAGGSGGGGGPTNKAGGAGNTPSVSPSQGNSGGTGGSTAGGGGGGAGSSGGSAIDNAAGTGGSGYTSSITGLAEVYSVGGDGGTVGPSGAAGSQASGEGGGGGGGGWTVTTRKSASAGNVGIVVVRYLVPQPWHGS